MLTDHYFYLVITLTQEVEEAQRRCPGQFYRGDIANIMYTLMKYWRQLYLESRKTLLYVTLPMYK